MGDIRAPCREESEEPLPRNDSATQKRYKDNYCPTKYPYDSPNWRMSDAPTIPLLMARWKRMSCMPTKPSTSRGSMNRSFINIVHKFKQHNHTLLKAVNQCSSRNINEWSSFSDHTIVFFKRHMTRRFVPPTCDAFWLRSAT